jgi:hypothetical protein
MQRGQSGDRQGCGLSIANGLGQNRHSVAATIDPLGPGARGQDADNPSARFWTTAVGRSRLDNPGKIPAGAPTRLSDLQGAPRFAAVERYCGNPDLDLVTVGITQADLTDGQPAGHGRVDDDGSDLLRHEALSSDCDWEDWGELQ